MKLTKIGECDLCSKARYLTEGKDRFDVHVMDVCAYGCNDMRSVPSNDPEWDPMEAAEAAHNDRPCFMEEEEDGDNQRQD